MQLKVIGGGPAVIHVTRRQVCIPPIHSRDSRRPTGAVRYLPKKTRLQAFPPIRKVMMERIGIEPMTFGLQSRRSPS
jgi:hypothetical protein